MIAITLPGPYSLVWGVAVVLFFGEILLALSYDGEDTFSAAAIIALMYLTYCQLWIVVVMPAWYLDRVRKQKHTWAKTVRFTPQARAPGDAQKNI